MQEIYPCSVDHPSSFHITLSVDTEAGISSYTLEGNEVTANYRFTNF